MKLSRRLVLRGAGGVVLALPFLESIIPDGPDRARAAADVPPFAVFFRQGCGVAAAQRTDLGSEPERFWPRSEGPLTTDSLRDRALEELVDYRDKLLVIGNVNMQDFNYGDGHARGALQCLTGQGPTVTGQGGASEAAGESLDHRIGRELNEDGRDSWFMYAGANYGWLGGPCISYRGRAMRRSPLHSPLEAYRQLIGGDAGLSQEAQRQIAERGRSVNDLVRTQLSRLLASDTLSRADRERLELHQQSIRDLEVRLTCQLDAEREAALDRAGSAHSSTNGDEVLRAARLHMDVAAVAIACGVTRSVAIQVGNGNDGNTRYSNLETGALMENYHYISHRRLSHGSDGTVISNADVLHSYVDRHFARTFRHLLDRLSEYTMPSGGTLLDAGICAWLNDLGNGPGHSNYNVPWIIAGSAGGFFKQGEYIRVGRDREITHTRLLNTIGTAVGLRERDGGALQSFGDSSLPRTILTELMAPGVSI